LIDFLNLSHYSIQNLSAEVSGDKLKWCEDAMVVQVREEIAEDAEAFVTLESDHTATEASSPSLLHFVSDFRYFC
jgi:hypothetical protein